MQDNTEATAVNAYMAGLVDGEGCIYLGSYESKRPTKYQNGRPIVTKQYNFQFVIQMTSKETIEWIVEHFGGKLVRKEPRGTQRLVSYQWRVPNDRAIEILKMVYPFLVTKKRQAALAFKFREVMKQTMYSRDIHRNDLRDKLVAEVHALNSGAVETAREGLSESSDVIQSELHGNMQTDVR